MYRPIIKNERCGEDASPFPRKDKRKDNSPPDWRLFITMSGMDETRDGVGVDSCWLEGKVGKGKKVAQTFCVTPLLSTFSLTLYTCQRQYSPDYSFAPLSYLALSHPYPQSSRSSQPATLQASCSIIGLASRRGSPRGRCDAGQERCIRLCLALALAFPFQPATQSDRPLARPF